MIDAFTKYVWFTPLKDKKGKTVFNAFIEIVNECKPNKLQVDQEKIYNRIMQTWLGNNYILMYFTHNEGKSVIAERFLETKAKIYKIWQIINLILLI